MNLSNWLPWSSTGSSTQKAVGFAVLVLLVVVLARKLGVQQKLQSAIGG